jgi:starch-binding outer membrane protein, SusD/RagB family
MKRLPINILAIICLLAVSCSKQLNKQPLDEVASTTYWQTQNDAVQAVNNCYTALTDIDDDIFLSCATDDSYAWSGWPVDVPSVGNGSATSQQGMFDQHWSHSYSAIAAANVVLDNIGNVPASALSDTLRSRYRSEARFIRAYYYQQLIGYYGAVPLIVHVQTPSQFDVSRTSVDSVAAFVVSELTAIADSLPLTYDAADQGRVTRGAALAELARMQLYQGNYTAAATAAQSVMTLGVYSIDQGGFLSLFNGKNPNSPEIILAGQYLQPTYASGLATWMGGPTLGGWSEVTPTEKLVDDYECTDGQPITTSPLYSANTPSKNRDPRLLMTVMMPDAVNVVNGDTINITTPHSIDGLGQNNASFTGYYYKKYIPSVINGQYYDNSFNNEILIRYAEVLLTYAEAKIESNQIDQSVYDAINQVRQRTGVGQPAATTLTYPDQASLRTLVRRERHVEFAVEPQRLFDIRRWQTAATVMPGNVLGVLNNFDPTRSDYGQHVQVEVRAFNPARDYLWAIPENEILLNKNLNQNPNW